MARSREEIVALLKQGYSTVVRDQNGNRIPIKSLADIPPESVLAGNDPEARAKARTKIEAEITRLQGELALLQDEPVKVESTTEQKSVEEPLSGQKEESQAVVEDNPSTESPATEDQTARRGRPPLNR